MNDKSHDKHSLRPHVLGVLLFVSLASCDGSGLSSEGDPGPDKKASDESPIIKTNMFDLEYKKLHNLKPKKRGGGIGSTEDELIIITGDGQIHAINLENNETSKTSIIVPENNQGEALLAADHALPGEKNAEAKRVIRGYLRYDDILVFSNSNGRHLVVSYSHFDKIKQCFTFRISVLSVPASRLLRDIKSTPDDWLTVFTSGPCFPLKSNRIAFAGHQSGGRIDILKAEDGDIVLALGDFEFDGLMVEDYPQDRNSDYGKVWKINVFSGDHEIISIGHRNPQGIVVDQNGKIWSVEHGPRGGDELNSPEPGRNFGWPEVTLGMRYSGDPWPGNKSQGRHERFHRPVFSWVPSIAPSNLDQSVGLHPFWEGDLLVFTLQTTSIHRLRLHDNHVLFDEPMKFKERIRYGLNHKATGSIYVWTDPGNIYRIRPTTEAFNLIKRSKSTYSRHIKSNATHASFEDSAIRSCLECHTGLTGAPPDLTAIIGADIASRNYDSYSEALSSLKGKWTEKSLRAFLKDPQAFAPGTAMENPGLTSEREISEVLRALRESGQRPGAD